MTTANVEAGKPYHHGDLRQALLQATRELLIEGGVQAASLRAVARRAGVTNRAPYHHFSDKCSLLAAVAVEGFRKLEAGVANRLAEAGDDPIARLTAIGLGYLEFAHANPGEFQVMFWHEVCDSEAYPERDSASECCFMQLLETIQSIARRDLHEDELKDLAVTAWSGVHGFATLRSQGAFHDVDVEALAAGLSRRIAVVIALEVGAFSIVPVIETAAS